MVGVEGRGGLPLSGWRQKSLRERRGERGEKNTGQHGGKNVQVRKEAGWERSGE